MDGFFVELSVVLFITLLISYLIHKIKQPLIIGYIITGLIVGPLFLNYLSSTEGYETFSKIGIALLLFIVGLHLNFRLVKEVGVISLVTGLGQVLFTSLIGFGIGLLLGFDTTSALLIAIALTFSSTIIIVKLLTDKKDIDKLYGKISMGFLIVQDIVVVILLMVISALFLQPNSESLSGVIVYSLVFAIFAILLTIILSRFILPKILEKLSKSTELLFLFIISWCFGISALFEVVGFSLEVGALLAGMALASSKFQHEISSRVRPLRDFFILMFFILLGSQMVPPIEGVENLSIGDKLSHSWNSISPLLVPAIIFSLFILIGNPLIVLILMTVLGYSSRTGFLAGLTVAQISEFSLILVIMAAEAGLMTMEEVAMVTLVGIITITGSTYLIYNNIFLYNKFSRVLRLFERKKLKKEKSYLKENHFEIIILGYDRIGYSVLNSIKKLNRKYLLIDNNPSVIKELKEKKVNCMFGDASNVELLAEIDLSKTKLIISTIPDYDINYLILEKIKHENKNITIILSSDHLERALDLYSKGADYVILPHFLGGNYVSTLIENYYEDISILLKEKINHLSELNERNNKGQVHPAR